MKKINIEIQYLFILFIVLSFVMFHSVLAFAGYGVPATAGGWSRDSVNGIVYTPTTTDKVAIGQATANTALDIVGTVTATAFSTTSGSVVVGNNSLTTSALNISTSALIAGYFLNPTLADNGDVYMYLGKDTTSNSATLRYHKTSDGLSDNNYIGLYHTGASGSGVSVTGQNSRVGVNITLPTVRFEVRETTLGTVAMRVMIDNTGIAGTSFIQFTAATEAVVGSIDAVNDTTVAYNTFTGSHYTIVEGLKKNEKLELYTVLESTGEKFSVQEQCTKSRVCKDRKSNKAMGVYGGKTASGTEMMLCIGTGFIWVVNKGQDIEIGDYLMSSNIKGCAEKQDDDILHNYTIAKVTEDVRWKKGEKKRLVSCTYHGG